jgi:HPt (histidine-containing phosphotransfer) domain-containing protein
MIEQAVAALESGRLRNDLQTKAYENAHKLAGSLGCFGFTHGTEIARDLERIFEPHTVLGMEHAQIATRLLSDLRQGLGQTSEQKSIFGELMARAAPSSR